MLIGSWIAWFVIITLLRGQGDHARTLARPLSVLLAGSWIEFGVALPVELAKRDEDCPCAVGSWIALVTVIPISSGPSGPPYTYFTCARGDLMGRARVGRGAF